MFKSINFINELERSWIEVQRSGTHVGPGPVVSRCAGAGVRPEILAFSIAFDGSSTTCSFDFPCFRLDFPGYLLDSLSISIRFHGFCLAFPYFFGALPTESVEAWPLLLLLWLLPRRRLRTYRSRLREGRLEARSSRSVAYNMNMMICYVMYIQYIL